MEPSQETVEIHVGAQPVLNHPSR